MDDSDRAEVRDRFEEVIRDYMHRTGLGAMPVIEDWVIIATINDLDDDDNGKWFYMRGDKQAVHRTLGLLEIARDSLLAPEDD